MAHEFNGLDTGKNYSLSVSNPLNSCSILFYDENEILPAVWQTS